MRYLWGILVGTREEVEEMMEKDIDSTLEVDWAQLPKDVDFTVEDLLKARRPKKGWKPRKEEETSE